MPLQILLNIIAMFTKLAGGEVISILVAAMDSQLPARLTAHRTSATPGPANRGDLAGDGPAVQDLGIQTAKGHLPRDGRKARAPPHHTSSGLTKAMATGSGERARVAAAAAIQSPSQEAAFHARPERAARAPHSSRPRQWPAHLQLLLRRQRALTKAVGIIDLTRPEPQPGLPPFRGALPTVPTGLWADGDPPEPPRRQPPPPAEVSDDDDWGTWTGQSAPSTSGPTRAASAPPPWRSPEQQSEGSQRGIPSSRLAPAARTPSAPSKAPVLLCAYRGLSAGSGRLPPECV